MPRQIGQSAHGVVELVEGVHHGALDVEHERQDGSEFFVQCEAELAVRLEAAVAGGEDLKALRLGLGVFDKLGGMDDGAPGFVAARVGIDPNNGGIVGFFDPGHGAQQVVDAGRRDAVDLDIRRWDRAQLKGCVQDNPEKPDAANYGVEKFVRAADGDGLSAGKQKGKADDLAGEAAVPPRILAVDVGTDRTGDAGVRFGRAGRQHEQAVVDCLVDVDEPGAGLDGDLGGLFVKGQDSVHGAHVEQCLAVVEGQVPVAASGPACADGHAALPAVGQGLTALLDGRWPGHKGACSDGANQ